MAMDRFYKSLGPQIPHLAQADHELADLRNDMYEAFRMIAAGMPLFARVEPTTGTGLTRTAGLTVLDSEGGDPIDRSVVLSFGGYLDENGVALATDITWGTATFGAVLSSPASSIIVVQTDNQGRLFVPCTKAAPGDVYFIPAAAFKGPAIFCETSQVANY
jgi:hypothetical protein